MYIYQIREWPNFIWDSTKTTDLLAEVRYLQGCLIGRMQTLGFELLDDASLQILTQDVIKTSEIEGENLDKEQVRSSLAKRLGLDIGSNIIDRNVEGIVEIMLDATQNFNQVLTKERLCNWQAGLFPTGRSQLQRIVIGDWRGETSGAMQVISGAYGKEKIHFEAPGFERLDLEMQRFLQWFNDKTDIDLVIKAAISHFWFVTIHPFDDGNGRIARAITDMTLARSENSKKRFYSMSTQIQRDRKSYYDILENCQKGSLDITFWLVWFLNCLKKAINSSEDSLVAVMTKARFWEKHRGVFFNDRQRLILNMLLDTFEGKLTSTKWSKLTKCSQDTALRDISDLIKRNILAKEEAGGRSTSYQLLLKK